jgi:hypothetical protein
MNVEEKNAAVFDFDGVLYSSTARWKVIDTRLGVIGSRVTWERGLRLYDQASQKFEGIKLTECFAPDEFEFASVREHPHLTLPQHLMKTAQNHAFRGHDLFVLSRYAFRDFLRVNERFMGQPGPLPLHENPFEQARILATENYSAVHGDTRLSLEWKFRTLAGMLSRKEDAEPKPASADAGQDVPDPGERYTRVFLYYTEPAYAALVEDFIRRELEALTGGRNAIVASFIAHLAS